MWPKTIDWQDLNFGVEIEFIGGNPQQLELLPGWVMAFDEQQLDETGAASGSELQSPPMRWVDRGHIGDMLRRLSNQGAAANWSCGLHVHIGLEQWGEAAVLPLLRAALRCQHALRQLLQTSKHRLLFCPPATAQMLQQYISEPGPAALRYCGCPQSHRCGINLAAWHDIGTVEIRYANGSLQLAEVLNTIELCLRFVAAIGDARRLPDDPQALAAELGAPAGGYPPAVNPPQWFKERCWLEESLIPILGPLAAGLVESGEIHHLLPVPEGILMVIEQPGGHLSEYVLQPPAAGWKIINR